MVAGKSFSGAAVVPRPSRKARVFALLLLARPLEAAILPRANPVVPSTLPGTWNYAGCWQDDINARTLSADQYQDANNMTDESCIAYCGGKNYVYAGTEYGAQCYCGNKINAASNTAAEADCNMACSGNATEVCGGPSRLTMFNSGQPPPANPIINPGPGAWTSIGCYSDSVGARTLLNNPATPGGVNNLTIALCTTACANGNYVLAGAEYGGQCYCGNSTAHGGSLQNIDDCNMPCNGNSSELCGGPNRLQMYSTLGWKLLGCFTDSSASPSLAQPTNVTGGASAMTVEACTAACQNGSYQYSGVENGGQCFCGNANGGTQAPSGDCNVACNNSTYEICGGQNRLDVYSFRGNLPGASSTSATATGPTNTATTSSGTATSTSASTSTTLPTGWSYKGCYNDPNNGRVMANQQPDSQAQTVQNCIQTCSSQGYSGAGLEYGVQCFCDNQLRNNATLASSDSACSMACGGNANEKCGAGNEMSVYANTTLKVYPVPSAQTTGLPGSWKYAGCLPDLDGNRTFPYKLVLTNNNTATNCLTQCQTFGYNAAGMEYGQECWCGDIQNAVDLGRTVQPDSQCDMACTGAPQYNCGGGDRMSYYTWNGTSLASWNFATGAAAGLYEFLIGGVIIPLIATPAKTGKIVFMEKFGTEPANNSTGTYELDLTALNNFTQAWRPLHVKSDIFCSAGLTLPDKAARQINVGGWALGATFGVRLYWPDGSPGVWGKNDWQENANEVSLQAGRWYPSAMIMANGSILVVGGEAGSNGAPVPTLEILPKPTGGGLVQCPFLARTDPYSTYPFLAVLPGGGVFIAYYNEARILDEVSFNTTATLPNIPGAVNDFLGGRTYPFEGTAVLMPQHAPYAAPLTVMICGGSTPGPEIALDNCVSIQPQAKTPVWTIERMPSKRVITCMTALPDGTYLILNGGQQGVAGFGLGSQPNHNAVLYNPTKPVHARMTVMANTTITRLYHSEAVLLDDGRVLVSGSDPEDNTNPQEYRVEVFMPPYLQGGAKRPTFTIAVTDWAYGKAYTIKVGNGGADSVSLIGATSSTHGNSMGQRTIFPAVKCTATACTITAPPNAHVCPPGWFQLFALKAGIPSHARWVRIGGDPAMLGNWPNFPDFTIPGV